MAAGADWELTFWTEDRFSAAMLVERTRDICEKVSWKALNAPVRCDEFSPWLEVGTALRCRARCTIPRCARGPDHVRKPGADLFEATRW